MLRSTFLQGVVAAAATTTTTPVNPNTPTQFLQQLTLGVNISLTGPYGSYGQEVAKGARAAVDETNKYNATLNKVYGLRTFDDQNSTAIATSNVLVAAADPSIVGMIGNLTLETTMAALPQYANSGFAVAVPTVTGDLLTKQGYHNVFRLPTTDSAEGQLFASAVLRRRASMRVVVVVVDKDYGIDTANAFVAQAKSYKHDTSLLALEQNPDIGDSTAIIAREQPAYLFFAGRPDKLAPIAANLRTTGYTGEMGFSDSFYSADLIKTYGKVLSGGLVASNLPPLDRVPSIVQYYTDFHNEVGSITAFSAYGYAAAQLLIQAAQRSNTLTRFGLLAQLQQGGTYSLMVGQYSFNPFGDAQLPNIYLFTISADNFTYAKSAVPDGFVV